MSDRMALSSGIGGPRTQKGKEVVRWNSLRHGISSPAPVVPGLEKPQDWDLHLLGVLESLKPEGHFETVLAERAALLVWRLHRVTRFETEVIATSQEKIEEDIHERGRLLASLRGESLLTETHPEDIRCAARYYKQTYNALRRFPSQGAHKTLKGADATSVVCGVLIAAQKATGEEIDVESLGLPGVPQDACIEELPDMKVADVRGCVEAIASAACLDPGELLAAAIEEARYDAVRSAYRKEEVEQEISRKSRERIVPDEATLQKIARYEAHLSRQLYHALHELEALQTRRLGGVAPLARLDVQGLPES